MEGGSGAEQVAPAAEEVSVSPERGKLVLWAHLGTAAWWLTHVDSRECVNITEILGWSCSNVELDYKLSGSGVVSMPSIEAPTGCPALFLQASHILICAHSLHTFVVPCSDAT